MKKEVKYGYPESGPLADVTRKEIKIFKNNPDKFDPLRQRVLAQVVKELNLNKSRDKK